MSELESKAVDILNKLESITTEYAPEVTDAAIAAVQVTAVSELVFGVVAMLGGFLTIRIAKSFSNYARTRKDEGGYMSDWDFGVVVSNLIGVVVGAIFFLTGIGELFNVWNYVALYNPELAMAHRLLGL